MAETPSSPWYPISTLSPNWLAIHMDLLHLIDPPLFEILDRQRTRLEAVEVQTENNRPIRVRVDGVVHELAPSSEIEKGFCGRLDNVVHQQLPFLVLAGSGFGPELDWIHQKISPLTGTVVLGMECDPLPILIALSLQDRRQQILSGLITWAIGDPIGPRLIDAIQQHALFFLFTEKIELVFGATANDDARRKSYADAFQIAIREITPYCETMNRIYQNYLQTRTRRSEAPSHVWSSGSISEYTTTPILRAIHRGLESAGMHSTFSLLPRGRTRKLVEFKGLMEANPDTVFCLNDPSRGSIPDGEFYRAVWITDDPTFRKNLRAIPRYDERELVLFADPVYETSLIEQGAVRRMHLPVFALLEGEGCFREELAYPLVFVGMIWNLQSFLQRLNRSDRDLLEEMYAEALDMKIGTLGLKALWEHRPISPSLASASSELYELSGRSPDNPAAMMAYIVYMLDVYRRRWRMAEALLPLGLHVYGNKEWLSLLGDRYADRYHGFIPYENLADLYRSAQIVIGIHSLQLPTALNIRDCDILMAGGCLLTDPVDAMNEKTLLPGRDCETADTPEKFVEKAQCLLENKRRRGELSAQGRATILDRYLPRHRAPAIVQALKET